MHLIALAGFQVIKVVNGCIARQLPSLQKVQQGCLAYWTLEYTAIGSEHPLVRVLCIQVPVRKSVQGKDYRFTVHPSFARDRLASTVSYGHVHSLARLCLSNKRLSRRVIDGVGRMQTSVSTVGSQAAKLKRSTALHRSPDQHRQVIVVLITMRASKSKGAQESWRYLR